MKPLSRIYLYDDPATEGLDVHDIAEFLRGLFPHVIVEARDDMPFHHQPGESLDIESARVHDLNWPGAPSEELTSLPAPPEEGSLRLDNDAELYDGVFLARLYAGCVPSAERADGILHIAFVDEILGRFEEEVFGFKLRVVQPGPVTLISTSGIIEAPERPDEYYFVLTQILAFGDATEEDLDDLEDEFADRCLSYGDARLTEALKGYVLQAVAHHLTGTGACDDPDCRLFEAQTHEALLRAQCSPCTSICDRCAARLGLAQDRSEAN